jgi:hypothetical protein
VWGVGRRECYSGVGVAGCGCLRFWVWVYPEGFRVQGLGFGVGSLFELDWALLLRLLPGSALDCCDIDPHAHLHTLMPTYTHPYTHTHTHTHCLRIYMRAGTDVTDVTEERGGKPCARARGRPLQPTNSSLPRTGGKPRGHLLRAAMPLGTVDWSGERGVDSRYSLTLPSLNKRQRLRKRGRFGGRFGKS